MPKKRRSSGAGLHTLPILLALCCLLGACRSSAPIGEEITRDWIQTVKIEYLHEDRGDRILTTTQATEDAVPLLDALLSAKRVDAPGVDWYSPTYSATHRISLSGSGDTLTLYYDMGTGILSWPRYTAGKADTDPPALDYYFYEPTGLDEAITEQKQYAVIPFVSEGSTPKHLDVYLRASIVESELQQEGENINYDTATPPDYQEEQSLYHVVSSGEREDMPVPKGQYLIVAAMGKKSTSGYDVSIERIEINDHYTKIYINQESPIEGEPVEPTPSSPIDAVLVEQNKLSTKKIVVFLDALSGEILALQKLT